MVFADTDAIIARGTTSSKSATSTITSCEKGLTALDERSLTVDKEGSYGGIWWVNVVGINWRKSYKSNLGSLVHVVLRCA